MGYALTLNYAAYRMTRLLRLFSNAKGPHHAQSKSAFAPFATT